MLSRIEALGIATDFMAGVLVSKMIKGGLHYGLGGTLAVRREAIEKIGGLMPLVAIAWPTTTSWVRAWPVQATRGVGYGGA